MASRAAPLQASPLNDKNILHAIFGYLPLGDLPAAARVCHRWNRAVWTAVRRLCFRSVSTNLRTEVMEHILQRCSQAVHIDLSLCDHAAGVLRGVQMTRRASQLRSLRLMGCNVPHTVLESISTRLKSLRILDVAEVPAFSGPLLRSIAHTAPQLTHLDMSRSAQLTDDLLKDLSMCLHLRRLVLDTGQSCEPHALPPPLTLKPLLLLTALTSLHLARISFTDAALGGAIRAWPRLTCLSVYRAYKLGHHTIDALARCTVLTKLAIWDAPEISDDLMQRFVSKATSLTRLTLYDTGVTQTFVANLRANNKNLKLKGEGRKR